MTAVRRSMAASGLSARAAAARIGIPTRSFQAILDGVSPSLDRVGTISQALGLECYVGPPRASARKSRKSRTIQDVLNGLEAGMRDLNDLIMHADALDGGNIPFGARPVPVLGLEAAAGGGAFMEAEQPMGRMWFRRDGLEELGLDPTQCAIIRVRGESMEPTLTDGAPIMVSQARRRCRPGHIYAICTEGQLVVKRAARRDSRWFMTSDHDAWPDLPWPDDADVLGEVVWTARWLP